MIGQNYTLAVHDTTYSEFLNVKSFVGSTFNDHTVKASLEPLDEYSRIQ